MNIFTLCLAKKIKILLDYLPCGYYYIFGKNCDLIE